MISLKGKSVLVTGGSRGIGKSIALTLAEAGADVAINGRNPEALEGTVAELKALGSDSIALPADIADGDSVTAMAKSFLEKYGKIDALINNAGITKDNLLMRMKEDDWDAVLNTNLKSAFLCSKAFSRAMLKARSGKIINITSVVGITGNAGQANYAAAKAGMIGLTKTLAKEFASKSINVNAIAPGFIRSDMTDQLPDADKAKYTDAIPLSRFGDPKEIAAMAAFLSSSLSDYITGQTFTVDGGISL